MNYTKYCDLRIADFLHWYFLCGDGWLLSEYTKWSIQFVVFILLCGSTYCFKIQIKKSPCSECTHTTETAHTFVF